MTIQDFAMWEAYYELEPSIDQRIDFLVASVREMIYNVAVPARYRLPIEKFLLKFETRQLSSASGQTWQQQKAMMLLGLNQGKE